MAEIYANNVRGKLAEPILAADTSITLQPGHNFPNPGSNWYRATLYRWEFSPEGIREFDHEVVKVTALSGDVLTVEREIEGIALAFDPDTPIELRMTAGTASAIEGRASQALSDHTAKTDPHTQYEQKVALKAAAYRGVVGGEGPVFALRDDGTSPSFIDDVNQVRASGVYYALGSLNRPGDSNGHLFWGKFSSDFQKYLFLPQGGSNRAWVGGSHNGVFSQPTEIYTRQNILGGVSKSGGAPSGGIIERGSNSDGDYVKFADGTLICTAALTLAISNSTAAYVVWDFPFPFSGLTSEFHVAENSNYFPYNGNASNESIRVGLRVYNDASVNTTQTVRPTAFGTWSS